MLFDFLWFKILTHCKYTWTDGHIIWQFVKKIKPNYKQKYLQLKSYHYYLDLFLNVNTISYYIFIFIILILFDRKTIYFYLFCLLFIWIIFRMARFLQMNSQRPSMLPPKAKLFPAYPLHSNFSLKINSEHLMLTVRSLIYTFIYYY